MSLPAGLITNRTAKLPGDYKQQQVDWKSSNALPGDHAAKIGHGLMEVVAYGPPPGKPRMTRRDKWAKRPAVMRYRDWSDRLRAAAGNLLPRADKVTSITWSAYFAPPKSWKIVNRVDAIGELHRAKPDLDNIAKAVLDSLWPDDDSAIAVMQCDKAWSARPRIEIIIRYDEQP